MPQVCILPDHKRVEANRPETLLQVSLRAGVAHAHACGGNARCSTCRIFVQDGLEYCEPRNEKEQALAERLHFGPEIRLACQTVINGNVEIRRLVLDDEDLKMTAQLAAGEAPSPVGEEKSVAILFADIRGFTSFAETLPPYDVVHVLNRYFHQAGKAITQNGGHIDNYMGDGLMALFGVEDPIDAAAQAVRAALDMLSAVERLRPYLENIYTRSFRIGIGVHYGEVVVGAIGHDESKRVTAIGDAVNFASRIESANKSADTVLLISEDAYEEVRDRAVVGKTVRVPIPGKSGEYTLYEIVGLNK
ncbi:MAG TPA: adenylate/guanylate cyclase domain-containing protein [Blastocatellia bacterium]|nr:adenylate/guanylate cyclase domain-containing protein [Blastocatellia bacterium]